MTPKEKPTPLFDPKVLHEQPVFRIVPASCAGARASAAGELREGRQTGAGDPKISAMLAEIIGTTRQESTFHEPFRKRAYRI